MATRETKAEADLKTAGGKAGSEAERVATVTIDLRGPAEFVTWMRENRPARMGLLPILSSLLPAGTREHMMNAQREQLLAMRSLVDSVLDTMINRLEQTGEKAERKATKVNID